MSRELCGNEIQQQLAWSGVNVVIKRRVASRLKSEAVIDSGKIRTRDGMRIADCPTRRGRQRGTRLILGDTRCSSVSFGMGEREAASKGIRRGLCAGRVR